MNENMEQQAYLPNHFEEIEIQDAKERPIGATIWITGIVVSSSASSFILADPTGKINVYSNEKNWTDLKTESTIRVLGRLTPERYVEAEWVIHLNIPFEDFVKMREIEKRRKL